MTSNEQSGEQSGSSGESQSTGVGSACSASLWSGGPGADQYSSTGTPISARTARCLARAS